MQRLLAVVVLVTLPVLSTGHVFSTLFTAHDVVKYLTNPQGIQSAIQWCQATHVTKVYVETFRDNVQPPSSVLQNAKKEFLKAGLEVSGCVCTTNVGMPSNIWPLASCYTDPHTQQRVADIFRYAAQHFDDIIIDDFWFTDCEKDIANVARLNQTVTVGTHVYHTKGTSWEEYRRLLMTQVSHWNVLEVARSANPKVQVTIKYPDWYDNYQYFGYDVVAETAEFDHTWIGTECRDYDNPTMGGIPGYSAFFVMRWMSGVGGAKGGWYDWIDASPATYIEQARQTILGGAEESFLFCYSGLLSPGGAQDVVALRKAIPELLSVAGEVGKREVVGVAAYKPPNSSPGGTPRDPKDPMPSHPGSELRVFDFIGMLGIPTLPVHVFPDTAPAAFFSYHSLHDPSIASSLNTFIQTGRPTLITDGLANALGTKVNLTRSNVVILPVQGRPRGLMDATPTKAVGDFKALLKPLHWVLEGRTNTSVYPFKDGSWVVENFNPEAVELTWNGESVTVPGRGWVQKWL